MSDDIEKYYETVFLEQYALMRRLTRDDQISERDKLRRLPAWEASKTVPVLKAEALWCMIEGKEHPKYQKQIEELIKKP